MISLEGSVEHTIYRNEQNGYSVVVLADEKGEVVVVGNLPALTNGDLIHVEGEFITHATYGEQLKVERFRFAAPQSVRSMERYLASGVIKGIGPMLALRIVQKFKEDSLRILEEEPQTLATIQGISLKGAKKMQAQALEKRELRAALLYMDELGIPLSLATRIYERYGNTLYDILKANPYRLIDDITRVGFRIADDIARGTGLAVDSEYRIRSGLHYAMMQALEGGHIFLPLATLLDYATQLLDLPEGPILREIDLFHLDKRFVVKEVAGVPAVYLAAYYHMETAAASMLEDLNQRFPLDEETVTADLETLFKQHHLALEAEQQEAIQTAVLQGLTVITGGPGTGKTTIISAMLDYFEARDLSVALAAPTGRAAKRMTEATGRPAQTIHRLLEYMGPTEREDDRSDILRFTRNESYPLEQDVVIVDEVSMVDLPLLYGLLKAILPGTRLVLVGDVNQLPSVGPGNVLKDIIRSGRVKTIALSRIFRQEEGSQIVTNAHRIIQGGTVDTAHATKDFMFIRRFKPEDVQDVVMKLVRDKLPDHVGAPISDIQVITPSRKGPLGVETLNQILQEALNPPAEKKSERRFAGGLFRQGDKVMQIKNNYQKEWTAGGRRGSGIFNGDIGVIQDIRFFTEEVVVLFDEERQAIYQFAEMHELELAYAITVHKAQGSEYPAIVIPLWQVPSLLIYRSLIYTAITRARSCVCLVGDPRLFQRMIDNKREQQRYSSLHLHLQG